MAITPLRERPAFAALTKHHSELVGRHLRELFAEDPTRGERLCAEAAGLYLDYSKNRITDETMGLLLELAEQSGLERHRDAMFAGERINVSENRSVLHVALRMPKGASLVVDGTDVVAEVHEVLDRMAGFADQDPFGRLEGAHRQADPQHRQYRHRRVRPGAGDGLRGAAPLHRPRPDLPLRLERRLDRFRGSDQGPGSRRRRSSSFRRRPSARSRR